MDMMAVFMNEKGSVKSHRAVYCNVRYTFAGVVSPPAIACNSLSPLPALGTTTLN